MASAGRGTIVVDGIVDSAAEEVDASMDADRHGTCGERAAGGMDNGARAVVCHCGEGLLAGLDGCYSSRPRKPRWLLWRAWQPSELVTLHQDTIAPELDFGLWKLDAPHKKWSGTERSEEQAEGSRAAMLRNKGLSKSVFWKWRYVSSGGRG